MGHAGCSVLIFGGALTCTSSRMRVCWRAVSVAPPDVSALMYNETMQLNIRYAFSEKCHGFGHLGVY